MIARPLAADTRHGLVLLAMLPGSGLLLWFEGMELLLRIALALLIALLLEALALRLRQRPLRPLQADPAVLGLALVFALALPTQAPWWVLAPGLVVAWLVRHGFGGPGQSPFHPAMAGVASVLLAFPAARGAALLDGEIAAQALLVLAWLAGGIFLLALRTIPWQTPAALLATALLIVVLPSGPGDPIEWQRLLEVLAGTGLAFAAVYVVTDPASACSTPRGRLVFGAGVALLTWALHHGAGPAGAALAFAVLLMNAAAASIDRLSLPRRRP